MTPGPQQAPPGGGGQQCPFCQLVANPDQTFDVHETEHFKAWLDINPRARGHTMIVPKEHLNNMEELGEMAGELFELIRIVMEKAKNGLGADGVSVVMNEGEAGGQKLDHFYAQVFPRFEGEENEGVPTGAVFGHRDDLDQSDLEEISAAMEAADFTTFGSKGGPATDMIQNNRTEDHSANGGNGNSSEDGGGNDEGSDSDKERRDYRSSWDGEDYSWNADGAEFK